MWHISGKYTEKEIYKKLVGGGGFNGIGKFRPQRDKGLYMKLQQIRETGAKMVISPCHNCWDAIRDMMEVYHVHDIKWSFLKPIIIDMMIVPDHLKPQDLSLIHI